jgi:predicted XRE-type DNA-binding protein
MNLTAWLAQNDKSQTWLAEKVGVTQGAVSQWIEQGFVPAKRLPAVAEVTGLAFGDLNPEFKHKAA